MDFERDAIAQINAALETVHNPASASAARHEAQAFLETLKSREDTALIGWKLNTESLDSAPPSNYVRHFGLTLLENCVIYQFHLFDDAKRLAVREWVVQLAIRLQPEDPHFIREKVAYLWVSVAKRVWGVDARASAEAEDVAPTDGWVDMDAQLLQLWSTGVPATQEFTLSVLRYLFEDIYLLDDPVASRRMSALSSQTIEIVSSASDLAELYSARAPQLEMLRAPSENGEGWLQRFVYAVPKVEDEKLLLRLIETIKTTLKWVPTIAIMSSKVLSVLVQSVKHPNVGIRALTCDCLHILFNTRTYTDPVDFVTIVGSVFMPDGIEWLQDVYLQAYKRTAVGEDAADDMEYVFSKKFVELITTLGDFIENPKTPALPDNADISGYFKLMLEISKHPSLMVSGLVLQFWCSVLRLEKFARKKVVEELFPQLLQISAERCIAYDEMPAETLSSQYLEMDFDSQQEKVQFCRNYQRYMEDILRLIVCRIPMDGMEFLHTQMMQYFQTENGWKTMNTELPDHSEPAYILGCAQLVIVESSIRGVSRWQIWATEEERAAASSQVLQYMAHWADEMLALRTVDLVLQRKVVECLVQFAPLLKDNNALLLKILERVLESCTTDLPPETPEYDQRREMITELRMASGTELNRLAYMVPLALSMIYDDLERVISNLIVSKNIREHESVSFKSFLLVVSQRSPMPNREEKFQAIVDPVLARWDDPSTIQGLENLEWFMERVGVVDIDKYFRERGINETTNLLETPMDDRGRALKQELKQKWQAIFPIRPSRIFIQYTIERLDHRSPEFQYLLSMWKPRIQTILPHILQLVMQIMAYHNPANWSQLPPEVQTFVKSSCTERFWQVGISMQTKDEFENASLAASKTLRDFADSVGHIVRYTREYTFLTLGSISQLEETMYEMPGMGTLLCRALASTTEGVTSHAWRHMISLTVRNVVRNCPIQFVQPFFTEFLPPFLRTLDEVLVRMWQHQEATGFQLEENETPNDDDLSEEMMEEHLLRQLTAIVDRLLIDLVGQSSARVDPRDVASENPEISQKAQVRQVCRNTPVILIEVLRLCKHLMIFKDSRCCFNTCLIVRHLLTGPPIEIMDEIAPVIVTEIMPACLTVLADPFFSESHLEVGTILTLIYASLPATQPSPIQELASLLSNVITQDRLVEFESAMASAKSLRQQRGIFMEFLSQCRVLEVDEQSRARNKKRTEQRLSIRNHTEEDHLDSEALIGMFEG